MNVLITHYTHPEGYPPTLNAINFIAKKVETVTILSTDTLPTKWEYARNVELILLAGEHNRFKQAKWSWRKKTSSYIRYIFKLNSLLKEKKVDLLIIYDNIPFLFYIIASLFLKKKYKIWYHSHDVYPVSRYKKFSIKWLSATIERKPKFFNALDFFSLPAVERKIMFPLKTFKGKFFFIPNYPSKNFIDTSKSVSLHEHEIRIVYPGSPSHKNGFIELIDIMDLKINSKTITLTIIGELNPSYREELLQYAKQKNVDKQLRFVDRIPYIEMTNELKKYQIGWAIYKPVDLSVATAGSSSNKIYEFLANGLPIVVFDNEHHRQYLEKSKAVSFCDLTPNSIIKILNDIDDNFIALSNDAKKEFEEKFQFENKFEEAFNVVEKSINN